MLREIMILGWAGGSEIQGRRPPGWRSPAGAIRFRPVLRAIARLRVSSAAVFAACASHASVAHPDRFASAMPARARIQSSRSFRQGAGMELPAAGAEKRLLACNADFLERFQAVGDEARTDDIDAAHPLLAVIGKGWRGIGLEPLRAAEARLESELPMAVGELQFRREQPCGLLTFAVIGVTALERIARQAVESSSPACPGGRWTASARAPGPRARRYRPDDRDNALPSGSRARCGCAGENL